MNQSHWLREHEIDGLAYLYPTYSYIEFTLLWEENHFSLYVGCINYLQGSLIPMQVKHLMSTFYIYFLVRTVLAGILMHHFHY